MGLYDGYRLQNSTVVPMFTGTTAPEALEVGKHMQALYDIARTGAGELDAASENLQNLAKDKALADEVMGRVKGDIDKWSKQKDWENKVEDVRSLGRYYANRSNELAAPVKQAAEYQKSLDAKELNLTPEQKKTLIARSMANYGGLKKEPSGKLTGSFSGIEGAENINMVDWAEKVGKDFKPFKDASKIEYVSGTGYIVTRGNLKDGSYRREIVSEQRVQDALQSALQMDTKMQAFLNMESQNAEFNGSRIPVAQMLDQLPDGKGGTKPNIYKQEAIANAQKSGKTPEEEFGKIMGRAARENIGINASQYLRSKYAYTDKEYLQELKGDPVWLQAQEQANKEKNELGLFGDLVTGAGIDLTGRFGSASDITDQVKTSGEALDKATNEVGAQEQRIADHYKIDRNKLSQQQISDYFTSVDPAGFGKYKANLQAVESNKQSLAELEQLRREATELAVKKKNPNMTLAQLRSDATSKMRTMVGNSTLKLYDKSNINDGPVMITKENMNDYEVIDGGINDQTGNWVDVKDKNGKVMRLTTPTSKHWLLDNPKDVGNMKQIATMFEGIDWKSEWKQAATNIRSNSVWMPLNNKTTADGQSLTKSGAYASRVGGVLRAGAGGLSIKDGNLQSVSSSDQKDIRARIGSGKFDVLGVGKVGSDGKMYIQVSVERDATADDPADRFQTVIVGVDSNMANKLSDYAVQAGVRDNDQRTIQMGLALKPGSGYEQVLNMGTTGRLQINEAGTSGKSGKPVYEVVPNITGQASDAITYEVYELNENGDRVKAVDTFADALDLGAFLDANRKGGRTVQKKTK